MSAERPRGGRCSRTVAVAARELGAALDAPAVRTAAVVFALALNALFFHIGYPLGELRSGGLWAVRSTSALQVVFAWLPVLLALLVPALTMGAWSEERRAGTEELLLARPVRAGELVLGKFVAGLAQLVLLIAVALVPLVAVLAWLGPVDWGAAAGGAIGACVLGAGYLAIGQLVSALAKEPLSAFLIAALVLVASWTPVLVVHLLPGAFADALLYASPAAHYLGTFAAGLFALEDLVFHALLVVAALHVAALVVEARRWR